MAESIKPADLWAQITAMPRPSRVVDFPRKNKDGEPVGQLAIWVLLQEEQMICSSAAEAFAKKHIKELPKNDEVARGYNAIYQNASATEILFRACRQRDDITKSLFPSVEAIRKNLTVDEVGALFNTYLTVQLELGPIVASMDEDQLEEWIRLLGEGGSSYPLGSLGSDQKDRLTLLLASVLWNYMTGKSLPGWLLNAAASSASASGSTDPSSAPQDALSTETASP